MRAVLVALTMLTITPAMIDAGAVWTRKRVVVRDYTAAEWQPAVAEAVALVNAELPPRAPLLVYRLIGERPCRSIPKKAIAVCVSENPALDPHEAWTQLRRPHRVMVWARIEIEEQSAVASGLVCHELSHAVIGGGNHGSWVFAEPCPIDARGVRRTYRKHGRH